MANRKCIVCGTEYSYCPSCRADMKKPTWMVRFDKEDCKEIFETGCAFEEGKIDAAQASSKLQGKKLNNIVSTSLKETIAKIELAKKDNKANTKKDENVDKAEKETAKVVFETIENQPEKKDEVKEEKKAKKFFE